MTAPQPGVLFTGAYLTGNYNPGVPGGKTVFQTLANPPAAGATAEENGITEMSDLGVVDEDASLAATKVMTANTDPVKNFYDGAGVIGVDNDNVL